MNKILSALLQKVQQDRKKLLIYSFLDKIVSFLISLLNFLVIVLAIVALVRLIQIINSIERSGDNHFYLNTTLVLILVLVILIIGQFFLTIFLEIYKTNMKFNHYLKIRNSVENLIIRYQNKKISKEELEKCIDILYKEIHKKDKTKIGTVIVEYMKKGGK